MVRNIVYEHDRINGVRCLAITTNLGALNELIINDRTGNIIDGNPESKEYKDKFIKYAIDAFINKNKPDKSHLKSWDTQAEKMREIITEKL